MSRRVSMKLMRGCARCSQFRYVLVRKCPAGQLAHRFAIDEQALSDLEAEHREDQVGMVCSLRRMVVDDCPDDAAVEHAAVEALLAQQDALDKIPQFTPEPQSESLVR